MRKLICALVALIGITVQAKVTLPQFFDHNMVLQQQSECSLWGWTDSGKDGVIVVTSWDDEEYLAEVDKKGRFELKVKTPKAGGPYYIAFSDGEEFLMLENILIGEVWLCSGQSNMEMPMKGYKAQPVAGSTEALLDCNDPSLRLFTVKRHAALTPVNDVEGQWSEATVATVREFSATAYFFGRCLRRQLGVPVGLIVTAWGGSACEAWMQRDWLRAFPKVKLPATDDDVQRLEQRCPTALYNGQLAPLVGFTLRGTIWYQGEDNIPRYDFYAPLMARMVQGWRDAWQQGDFPFYYCQIAPYDYSRLKWNDLSPLLREQQAKVETMVENCRMAVLLDTGLDFCIHPRRKREAGERLAVLALAHTYDVKGLPDFAVYRGDVTFRGDTAVVAFDRSKEWVYFEHGPSSDNFEVAGSDRVFHKAEAWIERNRVYVRSDEVKQPVAVRYAFHDLVVGDLMHDGLPVGSFRTDDW